jgi:hypothetical protein
MRIFENSMMGKMHGPKREKVITGLRKLHDAELSDLQKSPSINRTTRSRIAAMARVRSCGICGEQSGTGAGFLRVIQFLPPSIPLSVPAPDDHHHPELVQ